MSDRTGNHGSGAKRRVLVMMGMEELSCTSMRSVCDECANTGQQYSATVTGQLVDMPTRGLDISRIGQLAD